jgi:WD40 repeat protein
MSRNQLIPTTRARFDGIWKAELDDYVIDARWSPNSRNIAAAAVSGPIISLEAADGEVQWNAPGHGFGTAEIDWHPSLELLTSAGQDGKIRLWEAKTGNAILELAGGDDWVEHVAWSPNGKLLASAAGKRLRLWDPAGTLIREYADHQSTIADIAWQPDGGDIVAGAYGALTFWNVSSSKAVRKLEWRGSILVIAWSPDGQYLATGDQDSTVHFWMIKTGKDLQMWGYPTKVREIAWDSTGFYLATGGGPTIAVWDCSGQGPEGREPILLDLHEAFLTVLSFHPRAGLLASADADGRIAIWHPEVTTEPLDQLTVDCEVSVLRWSPNGNALIVATESGTIARLDVHWS